MEKKKAVRRQLKAVVWEAKISISYVRMKVYFISGIAADGRLFKHIQLPEGFEPVYLNWLKPGHRESVRDYALRLAEKINTAEPFILIGNSLGGIIASEIALQYSPQAVIIIASVPAATQLPGYYKSVGRLKIHKLLPGRLYIFSGILKQYLSRRGKEEKKVLVRMIRASDPGFIRWGINAVLTWENKEVPERLFHIHGTRDKVFPFKYTLPTHVVDKGNHVMVINRPQEINLILAAILS